MFKTTGEISSYHFVYKRKDGLWDEVSIEAASREMARQICIGRYAPVKFANKINGQ